ncbi:MAG: ParM/StbA family protein [Burkholderiales bacterium]|nr:ParM/StbA family protein [Burkholderiales bacterium]
MEKLKFVGIDDGHDSIKLVNEEGKSFIIPSRIAGGKNMLCSINGEEVNDNIYKVNGDTYSVVDFITQSAINYIDTRTLDYPYSNHNISLINHILYKSGIKGQVSVLTGLPVQRFYVNGIQNEVLINKKVNALLNSNVINLDESVELPKIKQHRVISEALAGYFDLLFDISGKKNKEVEEITADSKIAIIDIGGRTTDIATLDIGGTSIDLNKSGTRDIGGLYLKDNIKLALMKEYNLNNVSNTILDKVITGNSFRNCGKIVDVTHIVNSEKKNITNQINSFINQVLDVDFNEYGIIAFIGGGSLLFRTELKNLYSIYDNVVLVDEPQFANARGMLKFNKYVLQ